MTITDRLFERMGIVTQRRLSEERRDAYMQGFSEAVDIEDEPPSGIIKKYGYASLGGSGTREATPGFNKQVDVAWGLLQKNLVARRAMALKRDYVIGTGVTPRSGDAALQEVLDGFWVGNKLDERAPEFTYQLFALGAQVYTVFVRESDGRVKLGYIDPGQIQRVITHPENAMERYAVVVKRATGLDWQSGHGERIYRIAREAEPIVEEDQVLSPPGNLIGKLVTAEQALLEPWERELLAYYGVTQYSGTCFLYRVNAMSNQPLGTSDLCGGEDWLAALDEVLFGLADKEQFSGYFSWDVSLDASADDTLLRAAEIRKRGIPKRGSVNVHNKAETWTMNSPDLKQEGNINSYRAIFNHAWGGLGYPEAWYSRGDETNRATIQGQGEPTWKSLAFSQHQVDVMLTEMCQFAVDQAKIAGSYMGDGTFGITMPEMVTTNVVALAGAFFSIMQGVQIGIINGITSEEQAVEIVAKLLSEMGVEAEAQPAGSGAHTIESHIAVQSNMICPSCGQRGAYSYPGHDGLLVCMSCGKTFDPSIE